MRRGLLLAFVVSLYALPCKAQDNPTLLNTSGWGSLSGKATHRGKGVADVVVFLKVPKGTYFPIHDEDKTRKDIPVQIPPGGTFKFRMLVHYPQYFDGTKVVPTGQKLVLKGDALQDHVIEFISNKEGLTTTYLKAGSEIVATLKPNPLPTQLQSETYREMRALVYVFDHPYHAVSDKDGSFTIARVPAGAEVSVMAWHESGWALTNKGKSITIEKGKKQTLNFEVKAPAPEN